MNVLKKAKPRLFQNYKETQAIKDIKQNSAVDNYFRLNMATGSHREVYCTGVLPLN